MTRQSKADLLLRQKQAERDGVTASCGCVFCDVGLFPDAKGWHKSVWHRDVKCENVNRNDETQ